MTYTRPNPIFYPVREELYAEGGIEKFILQGWMPSKPVIKPNAKWLCIGSCFASNFRNWIEEKQKLVEIDKDFAETNWFYWGDGFVNTHTICQQFEWGVGKREIEKGVLCAPVKDTDGKTSWKWLHINEEIKQYTYNTIKKTNAFIITLGLSEVWKDAPENVFFKNPPPDKEAKFIVSTVEENKINIKGIYDSIRLVNPDAAIIWTLSPVGLKATFRPVSAITANEVSKAILRVTIDEFLRETNDSNQYYFPAYEIVRTYFGKEGYAEDLRHITPEVKKTILPLFWKCFVGE